MRPFRPTSIKSFGSSLRAWGTASDGGVAVTVAVMTVVLVGVLALSVDIGRIYNASSDLNHAADAFALAGATQLDGKLEDPNTGEIGACRRAILAVNEAVLANQETFGSNEPDPVVFVSDIADPVGNPNIKFLSELTKDADGNVDGTYIIDDSTCDEDARYIEITLDLVEPNNPNNPYRVDLYFAGVTGALTEAFPRGYAVAEYAEAFCITVPMMMCALDGHPSLPPNTSFYDALKDYQLTGNGLFLKSVSQNQQWGAGNFGFLDLDKGPLGPNIGPIKGDPQCLTDGEVFTKPGSTSGARHHFNTRFDMWSGPTQGFRDEENYQPSPNGVKGLIRKGPDCSYGPGGYDEPEIPYTTYGSYGSPPDGSDCPGGPNCTLPLDADGNVEAAMPLPRDKCSYDGTCEGFQGRMGDGEWDRATYMEVNHLTIPYAADNDAALQALGMDMENIGGGEASWDMAWPSGSHPDGKWSRYEMYLWELDRPTDNSGYMLHGGEPSTNPFGKVGPNHELPNNTGAADGWDTVAPHGEYAGDENPLAPGDGYPQCYTGDMGAVGSVEIIDFKRDRRVETLLVVNCDPSTGGVIPHGKTPIPASAVLGTMEVLILEPWKVNGGVHEISTEIIGPGESDGDPPFKREWVQLKEGRNALK